MTSMRYAIYFMPCTSNRLWTFGSAVLGYDASTGQAVAHPAPELPLPEWTADPRRYGFHATLKAPFGLREEEAEAGLLQAAGEFARRQRAFEVPACHIAALGRFIALVPSARCEPLHALADACVIDFDRFRAPLSATDRARRLAQPLGPRLEAQLERWGYPYVFDDFQFHMTLSGPLPEADRVRFLAMLQALYAPLAGPLAVGGIAVFRQADREARFAVLERFGFGL